MAGPDPLLPVEEYFDYRGQFGADEDAPPLWLPHNQGDVFAGVDMPGISQGEEQFAMLFQHPCTMRRGPVLKPRVVMLQVNRMSKRLYVEPEWWAEKFSVAPLPDLRCDGATYAGDFLNVATVESANLDRAKRVSSLSADGRLQFQQRVIFYLTRLLPSKEELAEATNAVEAEVSLQGSWVERAVLASSDGETAEVVAVAEGEFDHYMGEEGRREALTDIAEQHRVIAEAHRELDERYPAT